MTIDHPATVPVTEAIRRRLDECSAIQGEQADGAQHSARWGERYEGSPAKQGLRWLAAQFARHYEPDLPHPYLYPMPEGGIQAEWQIGPFTPSLEIDLSAHSGKWRSWFEEDSPVVCHTLNLEDSVAWQWLARSLRAFALEASASQPSGVVGGFGSTEDVMRFFRRTGIVAGPGQEPDWSSYVPAGSSHSAVAVSALSSAS